MADGSLKVSYEFRTNEQVELSDTIATVNCLEFTSVYTGFCLTREVVVRVGLTVADCILEERNRSLEHIYIECKDGILHADQSVCLFRIFSTLEGLFTGINLITINLEAIDLEVLVLTSCRISLHFCKVSDTEVTEMQCASCRQICLSFTIECNTNILTRELGEINAHIRSVCRDIAQLVTSRQSVVPNTNDILFLPGLTSIVGNNDKEEEVVRHVRLRNRVSIRRRGRGLRKSHIHRQVCCERITEVDSWRNHPVVVVIRTRYCSAGVEWRTEVRSLDTIVIGNTFEAVRCTIRTSDFNIRTIDYEHSRSRSIAPIRSGSRFSEAVAIVRHTCSNERIVLAKFAFSEFGDTDGLNTPCVLCERFQVLDLDAGNSNRIVEYDGCIHSEGIIR